VKGAPTGVSIEAAAADPWQALAAGIMKEAVRDLNDPHLADDALEFFNSDWFETLCELCGIDPDYARRLVQETLVSSRLT